MLVKISPFQTIGEDARGLTAGFCLPRQQDAFVFITRKAGSVSGNTYHEGKTASTKPKIFILLKGEIMLSWRSIDSFRAHQQVINSPSIIEVWPFVTHKVQAVSDIIMLECNALSDIQNDRHKEDV